MQNQFTGVQKGIHHVFHKSDFAVKQYLSFFILESKQINVLNMEFKFLSSILKQGSLREFNMGCNILFKDPKILEFKAPCGH